jgi:arylsulfatase A
MAFSFAATSLLLAATPAAEKPPNVDVFLADDLGYVDLGFYGHPRRG